MDKIRNRKSAISKVEKQPNEIQSAIDYGIEFVKYVNTSKLSDGFSGGMNNREDEYVVLILPAEKTLDSFYSLKKPIIAIQQREKLAEIYAETLFLEHGHKNEIEFLKTHKRSAALLKLFFKQADAAVVTKKTFEFAKELNPQIGKILKIAKNSKLPAGSFGFFRKGYNQDFQEEILKVALEVTNSKRGEQLLTLFQTDAILATKVEELKPIQELYKKYLDLKKDNK